jgi:hypothetical protein
VLLGSGDRSAIGVRVGRTKFSGVSGVRVNRGVRVGLGVRVSRGVGELVGVSVGVGDAPEGVAVGSGRAGASSAPAAEKSTKLVEKHGAVATFSLMRKAPNPAVNGTPAKLVSYTTTIA